MFTANESARLLDINQRLRTLHIQKAKTQQTGDKARLDELQAKIDELTENCDELISSADAI